MLPPVRVGVLGALELIDDAGHAVTLAGAKQRALLAMLAVHAGHAVSTDHLVDGLFDGAAPRHAANALQHHVSRLRKVLGNDVVARHETGYALAVAPDDVDAVRFERLATEGRAQLRIDRPAEAVVALAAADALWRGEPLAELDAAWVLPWAARLGQLHLDLAEDRAEAELRLGHHHEITPRLEAFVATHPYRERMWAHLMVALYRAGRQTDALAAFRTVRTFLSEDKGLAPGPELRELEVAILRHDPDLAWTPTSPTAPAPATAVPPSPTGNLPHLLTSFIGREADIGRVVEAVTGRRLVTLTGPGGCGKTRLALEAGRRLAEGFPGGAWFVELAPLADPDAIGHAVAGALAADDPGRLARLTEDRAALLAHLRSAPALVVLDNCEHVVDAVAEWVGPLLGAVPDLHVVATSRVPLAVDGEVQLPVPPLALPPPGALDPAGISAAESVQLFVERAGRVGPFELTDASAPAVGTLCRHLDGLPLAIELAAARTKALPVAFIAEALDDRFALLVSPSRSAPARQRTLRATVDWSFDLLDAPERTMFELVSVFDGGCALEAGRAVAEAGGLDPDQALDLLVGLVDQSLVQVRMGEGGSARYDLLETLRAYGRERLVAAGLEEAARRAHRAYFVGLVEAGNQGLMSSEHRRWQRRLELELGNIRAAFEHATGHGDLADALRIAAGLWWFWGTSQRQAEGRAWLEPALATAGPDAPGVPARVLVRAHTSLAYLAGQQGDVTTALAAAETAVAVARAAGLVDGSAAAQHMLGLALQAAGRHDDSAALLAEARVLMVDAGDHWRVAGNDLVTAVRGLVTDRLDVAAVAGREVLHHAGLAGYEPFTCWAHLVLARVAERQGDLPEALAAAERALVSAREVGVDHYLSFALASFGRVARLDGAPGAAVTACEEAVAVAERSGAWWFAAHARVELAAARGAVGDDAGAADDLRAVVTWSAGPLAGQGREYFFVALGGDPAAVASEAIRRPLS
jgi:predicted ATPase/DNA-binding SARP family transcriptional activator